MTKPVDDNQKAKQTASQLQHDSTLSQPSSDTDTHEASHVAQNATASVQGLPATLPREHGGQAGLEPTRYGDWEKKGRCTDF